MPVLRYTLYTFGIALLTGGLVFLEIGAPGSLNLLVFDAPTDTLGTSEYSPVEWIQTLLLGLCAVMFGWVAYDIPQQRPLAVLLGGIALSATLRELHYFLDRLLIENLWPVPVAITAALVIVYTWRNRRRFGIAWLRIWPSPALALLYAGALVVFIFAQLIGHEPLWQAIIGDDYRRVVKLSLEEFIELFGYCLWFIGTLEFVLQARAVAGRAPVSIVRRLRRRRRNRTGGAKRY